MRWQDVRKGMTPLALAHEYMDCVFQTGDFDRLRLILADDLKFTGPFHNYDSADDYIDALQTDPPADFNCEMIRSYADHSSACLVYRFSKPGVATTMVQLFDTSNEKIQRIRLVFDTDAFRQA